MYQNIEEIETRKRELRDALSKKENEIGNLWDKLFQPEDISPTATPTQRILHYANTAAGVFDGALLGWKLYRKLNGMSFFGRKKSTKRR